MPVATKQGLLTPPPFPPPSPPPAISSSSSSSSSGSESSATSSSSSESDNENKEGKTKGKKKKGREGDVETKLLKVSGLAARPGEWVWLDFCDHKDFDRLYCQIYVV